MKKEISYEKALEELQLIVSALESEQLGMDELGAKVTRASELLALCKGKLHDTEKVVNQREVLK